MQSMEGSQSEEVAVGHHAAVPDRFAVLVRIHQTPEDATNESVLLPSKQTRCVPDDFLSRRRQAVHEKARSLRGTL